MKPVFGYDGKLLPVARLHDWEEAEKHGLRPSEIRFINGEPIAVWKDGSGIYGRYPSAEYWEKNKTGEPT
jgi:hypothetical protein